MIWMACYNYVIKKCLRKTADAKTGNRLLGYETDHKGTQVRFFMRGGTIMRKVLIPIDGSARSLKSIELVKNLYKPGEVEIKLLMVREDYISSVPHAAVAVDPHSGEAEVKMKEIAAMISEYDPEVSIVLGYAGDKILECAKDDKTDLIIMTKSTKKGWLQAIGSVTTQVVKYAPCMVLIAPEV